MIDEANAPAESRNALLSLAKRHKIASESGMIRLLTICAALSAAAVGQTTLSENTIISLQRTGCLGSCPVYKVTINGSGVVVYEGNFFVHTKGIHTRKIKPSAVQALVQMFKEANFFEMSGGGIAVDLPVQTISFTLSGRHKELKEGCFCPPELIRLEKAVDRTAGSRRWVRGWPQIVFHWPWLHL